GPSMIPTMAPDGSDIWLRRTYTWRRKLGWDVPYRRNDLVGFAHPDQPQHVSCKRIVGLAGDQARRTVVVPPGHVWVEADCPNFGIDSRHFGPIPVEWLQGKISARVWPLWRA
ncbi:predicted protein, partial [Phaeodactylum tricornutum CCAP 1055/1]